MAKSFKSKAINLRMQYLEDSETKMRTKSYANVKATAADTAIYATAEALADLSADSMQMIDTTTVETITA